ncbi:MFS transporter [Francisella salimarina]|uniref:MFS transporter n=1 Tax=Francisella salimarina TaxID=2599927 RepID=UPI003D813D4D
MASYRSNWSKSNDNFFCNNVYHRNLSFVISNSYNTLIVARFIQGAAILLCTYAFPIYITEISPANRRGMYVTLFQLFWTAGMCLSGVIIFFFYNALSWYQYLYITIFLVIALLGLICILPRALLGLY